MINGTSNQTYEEMVPVKCWIIYYLFLTFLTTIFVELFPPYCDFYLKCTIQWHPFNAVKLMKFSLSCLHRAMYTDGLPWLQGFRFPRIWLPVFTTNCENAFLTSERREEYGGNTTRAPGAKLIHFTEFTFHCLRVIHCRPLYNGQYSMLNPLQWNSLMIRLNFLYFDGKWWMRIHIRFGSVHIWSGVKLFFSLRKWFWLLRTILFLVHSAECYYIRQQFCTKEMKLHKLWFTNKVY